MERYWDLINEIVRESDIILEVLDARFPELSRNIQAEEIIDKFKRPCIIVLNKADLVDRKELEKSILKLQKEFEYSRDKTQIVYVSTKHITTIKTLLAHIRILFGKNGKRPEFSGITIKRPFREAKGDIIVGVIGYPNVGKSSIINSLSFKKKAKVSKKAGTTHGIHWIKASEEIRLIDTPGVIPLNYETEVKLGLIAARSPEKIKEPDLVAERVIEMFIQNKKLRDLEDFYKIKFQEKDNSSIILREISIKKNHLKKGGEPDEERTSTMIIKDWQQGKLRL